MSGVSCQEVAQLETTVLFNANYSINSEQSQMPYGTGYIHICGRFPLSFGETLSRGWRSAGAIRNIMSKQLRQLWTIPRFDNQAVTT